MEKILFVNACVRPESRTKVLAQHVLDRLEGDVTELDLETEDIRPLDLESLQLRDMYARKGDFSHEIFKYALQFAEADIVVLAAPYWDMSFPATVKTYFEAVSVNGITFRYTEEGFPAGMCRAKKLIYVMTAGGPTEGMNLGYDYVRALCGTYYGIDDTVCYKAEFLDVIGADVKGIMRKVEQEIEKDLERDA